MSLRSIDLKRPLRARSSLTNRATSTVSAAASAAVNGTMAMGMASSCPRVTSTTNSPQVDGGNNTTPHKAIRKSLLFIGLEPKGEIALEQRRIGRIRQWRGTIHGILDRLAHGRIPVALGHSCGGDFAPRHLRHLDETIDADARRGRFDPRLLDAIAQTRDIAIAQRARFNRTHVFFLGQLPPQFRLAILARALIARPGIGHALRIGGGLGV